MTRLRYRSRDSLRYSKKSPATSQRRGKTVQGLALGWLG